jgi:DNA-binding XRE family transcriptional regulator
MAESEVWLPIAGYEGVYEVSDGGHVRSLPRVVERRWRDRIIRQPIRGRILKPVKNNDDGHYRVQLAKNGKNQNSLVHVLVLETFVGPRPGDSNEWQGCHGDGESANNSLANLRWDTRVGNETDKIAHGTRAEGEKNGHARLTGEDVKTIRIRRAAGDSQGKLAALFGVTRSAIAHIDQGNTWKSIKRVISPVD